MIDAKILLLTNSDYSQHPLAGKNGIIGLVRFDKDRPFSEALPQVFSKFVRYDWFKRYFDVGMKKTNQEIIDLVKRERPKYVLWLAQRWGFEVMEETFDFIRSQGCIVICWFWDDHSAFDSFTKLYIPHLDYCVTVAPSVIEKYQSLKIPYFYVPPAASPELFKKINVTYEYDVSFVGTKIADREAFMTAIETTDLKIEKFGGGWNRFLPFDEMVRVFNVSKINLDFAKDVHNKNIKTLKARVFEVCMCGGFLLTEYTDGLEDCFVLDQEVVCFRDPDEARRKIEYYLSHDEEREQIARRGRERCLKDHTWLIRLNSIFEQLERNPVRGRQPVQLPESELQEAKVSASKFHLKWGNALRLAGYQTLARDELRQARRYMPESVALRFIVLTYFPLIIEKFIIKMWLILKYGKQVE